MPLPPAVGPRPLTHPWVKTFTGPSADGTYYFGSKERTPTEYRQVTIRPIVMRNVPKRVCSFPGFKVGTVKVFPT